MTKREVIAVILLSIFTCGIYAIYWHYVTAEELTAQAEPVQQEIKSEQTDNTQKNSTSKKQNREGQINICIPPEIKTEWKVLFASCNVNMTQGITFAIEHLKHEIDNGEAILTIGGVISKRK